MSWPYFKANAGTNFALFLIFLWIITCDYSWLMKKWTLDMVFVGLFFITFVPHLLTGNLQYGGPGPSVILKWIPLFLFGIFVNYYYMYFKQNYVLLGRIALVSIITSVIGSLQSALMLQTFPLAARMLAANELGSAFYLSIGIGGFGFTYANVFLVIANIYFFKKGLKERKIFYCFLSVVVFLSVLFMLISASYTISLLIVFGGLLFILFPSNRRIIIFAVPIVIILIIVISREDLGQIIGQISKVFQNNRTLNTKLTDLSSWFLAEGRTVETGYRLYLYESSFITFLDNPIFGIYGPSPNLGRVGGHSGWLDLLAFYGLFTSIPFIIALYLNFKKHFLFFKHDIYAKYLLTCQLLFIVLGFLNPIIYIYEIGFMIFAVLPSLPFLPYAFPRHGLANQQ